MAMTLVDLWVIEDGLWRFGSRGKVTEGFIIFFEQRINQRDEPSCNMTKNFSFPSVGLRPLIKMTQPRNEAMVQRRPLRLCPDRCPGEQEHRLFHRANPTLREMGSVKGGTGLLPDRGPSKVRFQLGRALVHCQSTQSWR
jgi:hypothetical protein